MDSSCLWNFFCKQAGFVEKKQLKLPVFFFFFFIDTIYSTDLQYYTGTFANPIYNNNTTTKN